MNIPTAQFCDTELMLAGPRDETRLTLELYVEGQVIGSLSLREVDLFSFSTCEALRGETLLHLTFTCLVDLSLLHFTGPANP